MFTINQKNIKKVIKICTMYYSDGMSQLEISKVMGISRSQVCKILLAAKENNIVNITITDPFSDETKMETSLKQCFDLVDVLVVNSHGITGKEIARYLASTFTPFFNNLIDDNYSIGVSSGYTISYVTQYLGNLVPKRNLSVVSLTGGALTDNYLWQSNLIAQNLALRLNAKFVPILAPSFTKTVESRKILLQEPSIVEALRKSSTCDIALFGIGSVSKNATVFSSDSLSDNDYEELVSKGAVSGISNIFFDKNGKLVDFSGYQRMMGIGAKDIKKIPIRIGIGYGDSKAKAIIAALKGGWLNYLVTDTFTANTMLDILNLNL